MGIRITWTDTNTVEDGYNVYRHTASMAGLTDAQLATYLLAELPADAVEYEDGTAVDGSTYFYLVASKQGSSLIRGTEVEVEAREPITLETATVGDKVDTEGGYYAGVATYTNADNDQYHILVAPKSADVMRALKATTGYTSGTDDVWDGLANTNAMIANATDHPAAQHTADYVNEGFSDWYLPSYEEWDLIYANLVSAGHAEFTDLIDVEYWSSRMSSSNGGGWWIDLSSGLWTANTNINGNSHGVRPVRRVFIPPTFDTVTIGQEIEGGIYAGTDTIGGTTYHIVAAKQSGESGSTVAWKTSGTLTSGTTSDTDGLANTDAMVAAGIADHPAAQHCVNYEGGGYTDWHMPARSQMTLMANNLEGHPEFSANSGNSRWSSTEDSAANAWQSRFVAGTERTWGKTNSTSFYVRPIRRVAA